MSVVFTNGCFDIIHRGHIELLEFCSQLGKKVIVGLNSDTSVRVLKGKDRPVNNQDDRKLLLEAIKYVDSVIVFEEETPYNLICKIKPDFIVKGGDYKPDDVVGSDIAKVVIFDYVNGYSTTKSIQDIANR
jgi:rfaE bifunctional protein nucleotidyltransferase chain/domain